MANKGCEENPKSKEISNSKEKLKDDTVGPMKWYSERIEGMKEARKEI